MRRTLLTPVVLISSLAGLAACTASGVAYYPYDTAPGSHVPPAMPSIGHPPVMPPLLLGEGPAAATLPQ